MQTVLYVLCALLLSACVAFPTDPSHTTYPAPTCEGEADCKIKWEAAQLFVAKNSDQKIQVATDVLIETFNPTYSTNIAMRVMKEPLGGGRYKLVALAFCNNWFGCNRKPSTVEYQFNLEIAEVMP
jgi:hypothetical protein